MNLSILRSNTADITILQLAGELTLETADHMSFTAQSAVEAGARVLRVGCSDVTFMDSTGLAVLVGLHSMLEATEGRLELHRPTDSIRRLLQLTGLDGILRITE